MATVNAAFGSLMRQIQALETTLSSSPLAKTPGFDSFESALDSVVAAGEQLLSASSAAPAGNSGPPSTVTQPAPTSSSPGATAETSSSAAGASTATSGTARLLPPGSAPDKSKPDIAQFTSLTGCDFATAAEVLYGTVGSNVDLRDWSAIMSSSTPLADAKASTAALYNSSLNYVSPDATAPAAADLLGKAGNFELSLEQVQPPPAPKTPMLFLCDGAGNRLRSAGNPQDLAQSAAAFGFDTAALSTLQNQLDAAGIKFRTGVWTSGFLQNA